MTCKHPGFGQVCHGTCTALILFLLQRARDIKTLRSGLASARPPDHTSANMFSRPLRIIALLATACLYLVHARQVNIGFQVAINTAAIQIFEAGQQSNFQSIRRASVEYTFIVPLTIIRRLASDDNLVLRLYTRPFDYDEDAAPEEVQVYEQEVYLNEQGSYDLSAAFNLTTNSTADVVNYLRAQVDIPDGSPFIQTVTGIAVLSYNSSSGSWTPIEPAVYAHQDNEARHAEYEYEMSLATITPIDTTLDTVITGQAPDLPVETGGIVIVDNPSIETGTGGKDPMVPPDKNTTVPPPDKYPPPDCIHLAHLLRLRLALLASSMRRFTLVRLSGT
jgi:hypothetical protein